MKTSQLNEQTDTLATHVLIGGMIFPWKNKAPYVASGRSILGGLEYNLVHDTVRCHICGKWFDTLNSHLRKDEGIELATYRATYGLTCATTLTGYRRIQWDGRHRVAASSPRRLRGTERHPRKKRIYTEKFTKDEIRARIRNLANSLDRTPTIPELRLSGLSQYIICKTMETQTVSEVMEELSLTPNKAHSTKGIVSSVKNLAHTKTAEYRNLHSLCQAQIRSRLLALFNKLDRTPTYMELRAAGLHWQSVPLALGVPSMRAVWIDLGIAPNAPGRPSARSGMIFQPEANV